jgi:lipoprotein-releasing system permease protein
VGIAIITASLIILLSAFNGIESMVSDLYTDFDPDIIIKAKEGKTFYEDEIDFNIIKSNPAVKTWSPAIEEIVVLKHEKKWINARVYGVSNSFIEIAKMKRDFHLKQGQALFEDGVGSLAIMGNTLMNNLELTIPQRLGYQRVKIYAPKRDAKLRADSNPFNSKFIRISGRIHYNKQVDAEAVVVPLKFARELLSYEKEINAVYVSVKDERQKTLVKKDLQSSLGSGFEVKTNLEKNELIFKTSKTEKMIVFVIMIFIFILAAFNLISSITMLFVEKKDNVKTMIAFGANKNAIFNIFFFEGLLVSAKGIWIGLVMGYFFAAIQFFGEYIPIAEDKAFPILFKWTDFIFILGSVTLLSVFFCYITAKMLIRGNFQNLNC